MTTTVTVSEFRNNLSKYLDLLVKKNSKVKLIDGRKGNVKLTLTNVVEDEFDWNKHLKEVRKLAGSGLFAKDEKDHRRFRKSLNDRFEKARKTS